MENIIVIDTETVSGAYGLMSVGAVVLSRSDNKFTPVDTYFGFSDEYNHGFYFAQQRDYARRNGIERKPRLDIEFELAALAKRHGVVTAYAYNAHFDKSVAEAYLPSLRFDWHDLMKPARRVLAGVEHYSTYKKLYPHVELTRGGVLKRAYSVECVGYYLGLAHETHVAIEDAQMETEIAVRLGLFDLATECLPTKRATSVT